MHILAADYLAGAATLAQLPPPQYAEVAFAGRSNVGKSSLINTLVARRKLVRTSSTPGCTRAMHWYRIRIPEGQIDFVDMPGYGYAQRSKAERRAWGHTLEAFIHSRDALRAVIVLVDSRRGLQAQDQQLLTFLADAHKRALIVWTKCDKLSAKEQAHLRAQHNSHLHPKQSIEFSAKTGQGRAQLWQQITDIAHIRSPLASA